MALRAMAALRKLTLDNLFRPDPVEPSCTVRLFTAKHDVKDADTLSQYEGIEADGEWYGPRSIIWPADATDAAAVDTITASPVLYILYFDLDEPVKVYGYFVTAEIDGQIQLLWAESFPEGPHTLEEDGDYLSVEARLTARSLFHP